MYGLKKDWNLEARPRVFCLDDYEGGAPRWCPGCGDSAVLGSVQRLCRDKQLAPEMTAVVSGIGCSSRFPHYMATYGFHSLHGRPLPVACGVRSRRPDLHLFVVTGDGDCCAIGTAHWIHAVRYNMKMTVMMFDNNIYGLTKKQTSPTTRQGRHSNVHPRGAPLSPLNPLATTISITNASFVAQTVDWDPVHLYQTLKKAHEHDGLAFVRILQRCPHFVAGIWDEFRHDPSKVLLLDHPDGIPADTTLKSIYKNRIEHDPRDMAQAQAIAWRDDVVPLGMLWWNPDAERYDKNSAWGLDMSTADRLEGIQSSMDRFLI